MTAGRHSARALLAAVAALAAVVAIEDAAAQTPKLFLPNAPSVLPPTPPVVGTPGVGNRFRGRVTSRERVFVNVAPDGRVWRLRAVQRLGLRGLGDYILSVPAPVIDVVAAPGSDSQPGLRRDEIIWQGFSPGHERLGAVATLRPAVAHALPVAVKLSASVGGRTYAGHRRMSGLLRLTLAVRNTTGASAPVYTANADPVSAARALDALRRAQARGLATPARTVSITDSARPAKERVLAPLQVTGTIAFPGRRVVIDDAAGARVHGATARFVARLDEGTPAARVSLRGRVLQTGPPQVRLVVTPVTVDPALRPPASTWVEAVRRGRVRQSGRELLRRAISLDLAYTRARQYETFLRAPDPRSANTTSYVFRVAAPPSPATATPRPAAPARGGSALVLIVGVATGLLAAAGVVVAWAHL